MAAPRRRFDAVLSEAIDEGLKAVLGETGREVVYYNLKSIYGLERESVSKNPEILLESLYRLFGAGAEVIERVILEKLCLKLGIKPENVKLTDFIRGIKRQYE